MSVLAAVLGSLDTSVLVPESLKWLLPTSARLVLFCEFHDDTIKYNNELISLAFGMMLSQVTNTANRNNSWSIIKTSKFRNARVKAQCLISLQ